MPHGSRARVLSTAVWARSSLEELADELPYASPENREALRAGIDFERWLLASCRIALTALERARGDPF